MTSRGSLLAAREGPAGRSELEERYDWPPSGYEGPENQAGLEPAAEPPRRSRSRTLLRTVREAIETVLFTLLIFFLIRTVAQNFRVEGYSMEPVLHPGQYLIVDKLTYRFRDPSREEIIVFEFPRARQRDFIKRVIGMPGETVEVREGMVFIDGQPLEEPYVLQRGRSSFGPVTVGPDEYFVLGDNRPNSSDSRTWGMLPRANIIGRAWVSYWPPQDWGPVGNYALAKP